MHLRHFTLLSTAVFAGLSLAAGAVDAAASGTTTIVADTTTAAPDGNGRFSGFDSNVVLNDAGQIAFRGEFIGTSGGETDNSGIFRGDGTTLTQIAREDQPTPDGNGSFGGFDSNVVLNDAGQVAFLSRLTGTSGGARDDRGIFRSDSTTLTQIAREGQTGPDNNVSFSGFSDVVLNNAGQAAFFGFLTGTSDGASEGRGIFRGDGSTLTQVIRRGQPAPDNNGSFSFFSNVTLNDAGQAAFRGSLFGTSGGSSDNTGIFRGDGLTLTPIAREGKAVFDNSDSFLLIGDPVLNDAGQAAFYGRLTGTSSSPFDDLGIFRGDSTTLTQVAREGQAAPDNNGSFESFSSDVALNAAGQAAFSSFLIGTSGGFSDDTGIFRGDPGAPGLTQVARAGQAAPTSEGMFEGVLSSLQPLREPALNDVGQLAFVLGINLQDGGVTDDEVGLFFYDDLLGLTSVARTGDAFDGSTITRLFFSIGGFQQDEGNGLNNLGQVAYRYELADGRRGVAIWTPIPEPASLALLGVGSLCLLPRRGRMGRGGGWGRSRRSNAQREAQATRCPTPDARS